MDESDSSNTDSSYGRTWSIGSVESFDFAHSLVNNADVKELSDHEDDGEHPDKADPFADFDSRDHHSNEDLASETPTTIDSSSALESTSDDQFHHQPLGDQRSIRLITLNHDNTSNTLSLTISLHSLDNCPPFEAISYTWSQPTYKYDALDSPIKTKVSIGPHTLSIPTNLYRGLFTISKLQSQGYLWADALCINQDDTIEKAIQISLMGDIFSQASRVIVWLGEDDLLLPDFEGFYYDFRDAKTVFEKKNGIGSLMTKNPLNKAFVQDFWTLGWTDWTSRWSLYFRFFQHRRWFHRLWIVQEVALAKDLVLLCGNTAIPWKKMAAIGSFIRKSHWRHPLATLLKKPFLSGVGDEVDNLLKYQRQASRIHGGEEILKPLFRDVSGASTERETWFAYLQYLCQEGRRFNCSLDQDHIYGLLGLAKRLLPEHMPCPVEVDYTLNRKTLFTQITLQLLQELPTLSTLSYATRPQNQWASTLSMPSWVPDYTSSQGFTPLIHAGNGNIFNACPTTFKTSIKVLDDGFGIVLSGVLVGAVNNTLPARWSVRSYAQSDANACNWLVACSRRSAIYAPTRHDIFDVLWRTLIADTTAAKVHPAPDIYGEHFRDWITAVLAKEICLAPNVRRSKRRATEGTRDTVLAILKHKHDYYFENRNYQPSLPNPTAVEKCLVQDTAEDDSAAPSAKLNKEAIKGIEAKDGFFLYQSAFKKMTRQRSLFFTTEGHIGLGSDRVKDGDEVWLIPGSRVPLIVRRRKKMDSVSGYPTPPYSFIGEAYVHGIMHSEAWKESREENLSPLVLL
jgi:hypothetical protein